MNILRAANLESPEITHGFFGRMGGVSQGIFASLNCGPGSGDTRADVIENRRRGGMVMTRDRTPAPRAIKVGIRGRPLAPRLVESLYPTAPEAACRLNLHS